MGQSASSKIKNCANGSAESDDSEKNDTGSKRTTENSEKNDTGSKRTTENSEKNDTGSKRTTENSEKNDTGSNRTTENSEKNDTGSNRTTENSEKNDTGSNRTTENSERNDTGSNRTTENSKKNDTGSNRTTENSEKNEEIAPKNHNDEKSLDLKVLDDDKKHNLKSGLWWKILVCGGTAGAVSRTCTAPLDRVKIHLQVHGSQGTSMKGVLGHMIKEGGVFSLWRGNGMNVLKIVPESALKFMAYEQAKGFIMKDNQTRELSLPERFVAGSVAGGFSQTMVYPLEVLKTRLALRKTGEYTSILHMAKQILLREGWRAFYKGYLPHLLGGIPYTAIDLAVYETVKNHWLQTQDSDQEGLNVMQMTACGMISSTCGLLCTYPFLLVRTKMQAEAVNKEVGGRPSSMTSVFKSILKREGAAGLYRGFLPNFIKVLPAVSLTYVVYEKCKRGLQIP